MLSNQFKERNEIKMINRVSTTEESHGPSCGRWELHLWMQHCQSAKATFLIPVVSLQSLSVWMPTRICTVQSKCAFG